MIAPAEKKTTTVLFNPFLYIAGREAMALGVAAILLAGAIGTLGGVHFDGVLDMHLGPVLSWGRVFSEGLVDWLCAGVMFFLVGKIFSRTPFRAIDVFGTQALARWPTVLVGLILLPPACRTYQARLVQQMQADVAPDFGGPNALIFWLSVVLTLILLGWMVALMYRAYSVSCNVKGARGVWTFIAGLVVAEVMAKIAVWALVKLG